MNPHEEEEEPREQRTTGSKPPPPPSPQSSKTEWERVKSRFEALKTSFLAASKPTIGPGSPFGMFASGSGANLVNCQSSSANFQRDERKPLDMPSYYQPSRDNSLAASPAGGGDFFEIKGNADEESLKDPLANMTEETIYKAKNPGKLLRQLLARLPGEHSHEICAILLEMAWHLVTDRGVELIPFRPPFSNVTINSTSDNNTPAKASRNLQGSWRSKRPTGESIDQLANSSSPPPLPKCLYVPKRTPDGGFESSRKLHLAGEENEANLERIHPDWLVANRVRLLSGSSGEENSGTDKSHDSSLSGCELTAKEQSAEEDPVEVGERKDSSNCIANGYSAIDPLDLSNILSADDDQKAKEVTPHVTKKGELIFPELDALEVMIDGEESKVEDYRPRTKKRRSQSRRNYNNKPINGGGPDVAPIDHDDGFDWVSKTDETDEAFNNLLVVRLVRCKMEQLAEERAKIGDPEVVKKQELLDQVALEQFKDQLTAGAGGGGTKAKQEPDLDSSLDSGPIGDEVVMTNNNSSNSHNVPSKCTTNTTHDRPFFNPMHYRYCVFCCTSEHSTLLCPEPPPSKYCRIRELKLCKQCLDPGHSAADCPVKSLVCGACGMLGHLSYVVHRPIGWLNDVIRYTVVNKPPLTPPIRTFAKTAAAAVN